MVKMKDFLNIPKIYKKFVKLYLPFVGKYKVLPKGGQHLNN